MLYLCFTCCFKSPLHIWRNCLTFTTIWDINYYMTFQQTFLCFLNHFLTSQYYYTQFLIGIIYYLYANFDFCIILCHLQLYYWNRFPHTLIINNLWPGFASRFWYMWNMEFMHHFTEIIYNFYGIFNDYLKMLKRFNELLKAYSNSDDYLV